MEGLIYILVSFAYVHIIQDVYGYMGFIPEITYSKIIIGFLFLLPVWYLGFKIRDDFFFAIWHIFFILYFFGQVIYYQYSEGSIQPVIANTIFLVVLFACSFIRWDFTVYRIRGKLLSFILIICVLLFIPIFIRYLPRINFSNLLLENVYETRFAFRDIEDPYFGYLRGPLSRVILPSLMIIAIINRKFWLAFLSGAMILFIFLVGALKSVFIGLFAAIIFLWGRRFIDKAYILVYILLGITIVGTVVFLLTDNTFLVSSFVRRVMFTPALIDNYYYDYFGNDPLYWSHNAIGRLFYDYPLDQAPNMYIGENAYGKKGVSANVGLVTEGFFSLNYLGVFLHSLFAGFLFIVLKQIRINPVFFGIVFVYIYYLNTSFLTVLLITHGLLFFVLYAYFFLNKDYDEKAASDFQ